MAAAAAVRGRWLFGPAIDLLFGCGLLYMGVLATFAIGGAALREAQPAWLLPCLVLALSTPHYGATLVRAYEQRSERRAYALFTVGATLLVVVAFLAGVRYAAFGALLFTLYLTWSPWHYTGQNYGIALMFLRRRGVEVDAALKRWIHASFVLSFALSLLVIHGERGADASIPAAYVSAQLNPVRFQALGIPAAFSSWAVPLVLLAYLATLGVSGRVLLRRAPARELLPFGLLVASQALWFSLPFAALYWRIAGPLDPLNPDFGGFYALWIALAHAAQYLWITAYYARGGASRAPHYARALAAGSAAFVLPWLLVAPGALGLTEASGLLAPAGASALILSAAVNLHHFILDGAIWKLRQPRVASILLGSSAARPDPGPERARRPALRTLVWGTCAVAGVASVAVTLESAVRLPAAMARGDTATAAAILDRLAWLGQDRSEQRLALGDAFARAGRPRLAVEQYERSAVLRPAPLAWLRVGQTRAVVRDWAGALRAYEAGLELRPDGVNLLEGAAVAATGLGRLDEARAFLERALALQPENEALRERLRRIASERPGAPTSGSPAAPPPRGAG